MTIVPEDFGFSRADPEKIRGGDASKNAEITLAVLMGEKGPPRDMVLLNSAAAIVAAERADTLKDGIAIAQEAIDSKRAMEKLKGLIAMAREFSEG